VLGFAVAMVARWGGAQRPAVAASGMAGPALVAAAYALAHPDLSDLTFRSSLYAIGAGLLAAILVAIPGRDEPREESGPANPSWGEADRYRPGNYLAESRPAEVTSPFRGQSYPGEPVAGRGYPLAPEPDPRAYPAAPVSPSAPMPEPARTGAHRATASVPPAYGAPTPPAAHGGYASHQYGGGSGYDYPTDEYPTTTSMPVVGQADPAGPVMGQPPQSFDESQSEWLRSLGTPAQRGANN
jgi:hypothetical protein